MQPVAAVDNKKNIVKAVKKIPKITVSIKMENHLQTNTAIGHKKSGTKTFGKGSFSEMNIELFMVQKIQVHQSSTAEVVSWVGLAWVILESSH